MPYIYHIADYTAWEKAKQQGFYLGNQRDQKDGFIHMSLPSQVKTTALKYYANTSHLVLFKMKESGLKDHLKWEPNSKGVIFPHYYKKLEIQDIEEALPFFPQTFDYTSL
ncbi:MAG: DUF952 domain-containing protein [Proteobacteria bacterium]|nr:DUF952 domain-containing protein [Pseudomonadota bacterium]